MRPPTPLPSKSVEVLLLESPEAFADALLARPPSADQNHLIARDRNESLRHFAIRAIHRLRRLLASPDQISAISYLFGTDTGEERVRARLLRTLLAIQQRGVLAVIGPCGSNDSIRGYLGALGRTPGSRLEATVTPTGWTIMSARAP